ncbi:MAG: 50S ribosomal protein L18 [Gemmatimonadetes bacterium]|nr:50S ribosomal protein L18 [Gemmatimonadota bacterium]
MNKGRQRGKLRARRRARIRGRIRGTAERPRLAVFRSLRNIEGQLIDDESGTTLAGISTLSPEIPQASADQADSEDAGDGEVTGRTGKTGRAYRAGIRLAEQASGNGITQVVFDRGGYPYHGRVRAFAEGARAGGLNF